MEILLTLLVIWAVTFVTSFLANTAQESNELKKMQRIEDQRQKRLDQLYGRD